MSVYQAMALVKDGATAQSGNEAELERLLGPESLHSENCGLLAGCGGVVHSGTGDRVRILLWLARGSMDRAGSTEAPTESESAMPSEDAKPSR